MSLHIVSDQAAAVEQPFPPTGRDDPLAAARAERRIRSAERKRIGEIRGRYKQAFNELASLEEELGRPHPDVRAARAQAWAVGRELMAARSEVDQRVASDKRGRERRAS